MDVHRITGFVASGTLGMVCLAATVALHAGQPTVQHQNGMVFVAARQVTVGTSEQERAEVAKRFDCHPTWLNDDLPRRQAAVSAFWIDQHPVTNAQYLAFVEATSHARPSWWQRWGGVFPREYANHPVAGISGIDAEAYAKWAGKRLPNATEWEAAIGGTEREPFAWGDQWPGPVELKRPEKVYWELPATRPVGSGGCGTSEDDVEDFAGQVLEWVSDVMPHHGVQFRLMKGASWFHEDPLNYRVASGWYAYEGWRSAFTGFRCALDGGDTPPRVSESRPDKAVSPEDAAKQLRTVEGSDIPVLAAGGGASRHLSIQIPGIAGNRVGLTAPETIIWNGQGVMTWRKTPDMTWKARTGAKAAYQMRFEELRVDAEFLAHDDVVEQHFTATNLTDEPGSYRTSSCFNLQGAPMFYDCEQLRTYALNSAGEFVPMRRLSRGGNCVRWITGARASELGKNQQWALLAVVSRDGRRVVASGRIGSDSLSVATNTLFTCLHTDSTVKVPPNHETTTRQTFWFLEGSLDDLLARFRGDLKPD
ncbi:MAG: SUMF1/EgtB/PvdO family nonheme iron enzyme [Pirellulaceae bacterium]|nr:SUMF1/EgtB/PvdO family nonheme iron enzyme [Pirellulaceae bacterium]